MNTPPDSSLTLAVTMGDPRGIGPEVILKALSDPRLPADAGLLVVGPGAVLRHETKALGLSIELATVSGPEGLSTGTAALLDLDNFPSGAIEPRRPDAASGRASLQCVEKAVQLALAGHVDAVVTCPISKEAIAAAGSPFPGHTEMLAHLTGAGRPVMLLVRPNLRVALVTTHLALREVPEALHAEEIEEATQVLADGLRRFFGITAPRIAVCGLNPHCGDAGRFGDEEERIILPAVERLQKAGLDVHGPRPADTVFAQTVDGAYDAVVALYHDQGLIPVKLAGLASVVNVTLGLPIVRTSVAHGTAYDIAGQGRADQRSLVEAIRLAAQMARAGRLRASNKKNSPPSRS